MTEQHLVEIADEFQVPSSISRRRHQHKIAPHGCMLDIVQSISSIFPVFASEFDDFQRNIVPCAELLNYIEGIIIGMIVEYGHSGDGNPVPVFQYLMDDAAFVPMKQSNID